MGLLIGLNDFDADKIIAQLRAQTPPEMLRGIDRFRRCSKEKQFELLALQLQHLVAALANSDALLRHVHERVCFLAEEDEDEDDLEMAN